MQNLKYISNLFVSLLMLVVCVGCSDDDEPVERLRPSLSVSSLSLEVGDSATLHVDNIDSVISAVTNAPQVVALRVEGANVVVKALAQGDAVVTINVEGARLKCDVTVTKDDTPQYDFSQELLDDRCRFVSPTLSMYYDTPGTIFSIATDGTIEVRSLISGDHISFNPGTKNISEGSLPNASLKINDSPIELKQTTLHRLTPTGSMWLSLLDTHGNRMVLVVTEL